jgi:hypothetical protein
MLDLVNALRWPAVVVLLGLAAIVALRRALVGLIDRTTKLKGGPVELAATQGQLAVAELKVGEAPPPKPPADVLGTPGIGADRIKVLEDLVTSEHIRATVWEYRYLNLFLVHKTQMTLDWLISLGTRTSIRLLNDQMMPVVSDPQERWTIVSALRSHNLIDLSDDGLVEATPKGREYAQWRGPLPDLLAEASAPAEKKALKE